MTTDIYSIFGQNTLEGTMFRMSLMSSATKVANQTLEAQAAQNIALAYRAKKQVCDDLRIEIPEEVKEQVLQDLGLAKKKQQTELKL